MESKWEESMFAQLLLEANLELRLRHRECMSEMQISIHVRIRESTHILGSVLLLQLHRLVSLRSINPKLLFLIKFSNLLFLNLLEVL